MKIGEIFKIKKFMIFYSDILKEKYIIFDEKSKNQEIGIFFKNDLKRGNLYFYIGKKQYLIRSRQGDNNKNNHLIFEKIF